MKRNFYIVSVVLAALLAAVFPASALAQPDNNRLKLAETLAFCVVYYAGTKPLIDDMSNTIVADSVKDSETVARGTKVILDVMDSAIRWFGRKSILLGGKERLDKNLYMGGKIMWGLLSNKDIKKRNRLLSEWFKQLDCLNAIDSANLILKN